MGSSHELPARANLEHLRNEAKQRLKDIVDAYPNTKAAAEARKQLEKLNP